MKTSLLAAVSIYLLHPYNTPFVTWQCFMSVGAVLGRITPSSAQVITCWGFKLKTPSPTSSHTATSLPLSVSASHLFAGTSKRSSGLIWISHCYRCYKVIKIYIKLNMCEYQSNRWRLTPVKGEKSASSGYLKLNNLSRWSLGWMMINKQLDVLPNTQRDTFTSASRTRRLIVFRNREAKRLLQNVMFSYQ